MKVFVMIFDGGILYDEVDDNIKDFFEDWFIICNEYVYKYYRNIEIKYYKFLIMCY